MDRGFNLSVERSLPRYAARYLRSLPPERFRGPRSVEDLPLYLWAKRLLRSSSRLGKAGASVTARPIVRPDGLDARLEHKVPQFFLRNITRVERELPDAPEYREVRTRDAAAEGLVRDLAAMRRRPPELLRRWNLEEVLRLRALLKRLFHQDDWTLHFGRELKERVQGPLYKYKP